MSRIQFKDPEPLIKQACEKKSEDEKWALSFKSKSDGKRQYWLYNYPLMFGAHSDTAEGAVEAFKTALRNHIAEAQATIKSLEEDAE